MGMVDSKVGTVLFPVARLSSLGLEFDQWLPIQLEKQLAGSHSRPSIRLAVSCTPVPSSGGGAAATGPGLMLVPKQPVLSLASHNGGDEAASPPASAHLGPGPFTGAGASSGGVARVASPAGASDLKEGSIGHFRTARLDE
jgi:hypothetical protein